MAIYIIYKSQTFKKDIFAAGDLLRSPSRSLHTSDASNSRPSLRNRAKITRRSLPAVTRLDAGIRRRLCNVASELEAYFARERWTG